jgi:hypothetical protein
MSSIRNAEARPVVAACPRCHSSLRPLPDGRQACDTCKVAYRPPPVAALADPNVRQLPPDDPEERRRRPWAVTSAWWFCTAVAAVCATFLFITLHGVGPSNVIQQGCLAAEMACYTVAAYVAARATEALARR